MMTKVLFPVVALATFLTAYVVFRGLSETSGSTSSPPVAPMTSRTTTKPPAIRIPALEAQVPAPVEVPDIVSQNARNSTTVDRITGLMAKRLFTSSNHIVVFSVKGTLIDPGSTGNKDIELQAVDADDFEIATFTLQWQVVESKDTDFTASFMLEDVKYRKIAQWKKKDVGIGLGSSRLLDLQVKKVDIKVLEKDSAKTAFAVRAEIYNPSHSSISENFCIQAVDRDGFELGCFLLDRNLVEGQSTKVFHYRNAEMWNVMFSQIASWRLVAFQIRLAF
jgi:hypothetical protein